MRPCTVHITVSSPNGVVRLVPKRPLQYMSTKPSRMEVKLRGKRRFNTNHSLRLVNAPHAVVFQHHVQRCPLYLHLHYPLIIAVRPVVVFFIFPT